MKHPKRRAPRNSPSATEPAAEAAPPPGPSFRWLRPWFVTAGVVLLLVSGLLADWWSAVPDSQQATYVGRATCITCHADQGRLWKGSHHDLAMQEATAETVLGDFNDAEVTHHEMTSRFFRRGDKFLVHTEGPDGTMADFEVKYCLGVEPLQQYMVEFDRPAGMPEHEIARLQVLRLSWDTLRKRWFYQPPPDVPDKLAPDDDLHWTGVAQRWNNMCADCHSTNLQKGYDVASGTYHTTFSEIDVSCETCHGPGSIHVDLARSFSLFWDRKRGYGLAHLKGEDPEPQIQSCAPCHSRRGVIQPGYHAGADFDDFYALEVPSPLTYFADGQIQDEVYELGSFLQSKMYHQKIRCTDCHDPHTARLKYSGNQVCTSCHQHSAAKYDAPSHHRHKPGSTGASCVECHMPETTYMEVDARRDHSLRTPRPDLSVKFGLPNACTRCHLERAPLNDEKRPPLAQYRDWVVVARGDPEIREALSVVDRWAADKVAEWFPKAQPGPPHFAEYLAPAWQGDEGAVDGVLRLVKQANYPAIVRAAGWQWLRQVPRSEVLEEATRALSDRHPLVRTAALQVFDSLIPAREELEDMLDSQRQNWLIAASRHLKPVLERLNDPSRMVRSDAANVLARIPPDLLAMMTNGPQRETLQRRLEELIAGWEVNNDRAGAHAAKGVLLEHLGYDEQAESAYRTAMRVEPRAVGPRTNLAAVLFRRQQARIEQMRQTTLQGDRAAAEAMAREAAALEAQIVELRQQELVLLERDARLAPEIPEVQFRYGNALYLNNRLDDAVEAMRRAHDLEPSSPRYVLMLALLHQRQQQYASAEKYAELLMRLVPDNPSYQALLDEIRQNKR
jgi:Flp pilus assembly protein TadD